MKIKSNILSARKYSRTSIMEFSHKPTFCHNTTQPNLTKYPTTNFCHNPTQPMEEASLKIITTNLNELASELCHINKVQATINSCLNHHFCHNRFPTNYCHSPSQPKLTKLPKINVDLQQRSHRYKPL